MKQYREKSIAQDCSVETICVAGAKAFRIPLEALPILWKAVLRLANSCHDANQGKLIGSNCRGKGKIEFLLGVQGNSLSTDDGVIRRNDPEEVLLLLGLQFFLRLLFKLLLFLFIA